jgi:hypothetical protein
MTTVLTFWQVLARFYVAWLLQWKCLSQPVPLLVWEVEGTELLNYETTPLSLFFLLILV